MLNNKTWWKAAFVRALKTVAQTAVATIGTAAISAADVADLAIYGS